VSASIVYSEGGWTSDESMVNKVIQKGNQTNDEDVDLSLQAITRKDLKEGQASG